MKPNLISACAGVLSVAMTQPSWGDLLKLAARANARAETRGSLGASAMVLQVWRADGGEAVMGQFDSAGASWRCPPRGPGGSDEN